MPEFIYVSATHGMTKNGDVWYLLRNPRFVMNVAEVSQRRIREGHFADMDWTPVEPPSLENE